MERVAISSSTLMHLSRLIFALICMLAGISLAMGQEPAKPWWLGAIYGLLFAASVVGTELLLQDLSFRRFSHATVGLLVGLLGAWLITQVFKTKGLFGRSEIQTIVELMLYFGFGFMGMMLALRANKEEFSLLIPYVRFRQESVSEQPLLVDTNAIIDGRIPKICATGFLGGSLIVPKFVIEELHKLADGKDEVKSARGKRGLESLNQMRQSPSLEITIHEDVPSDETMVDAQLVALARMLGARLLTNDVNLGKVAKVQGIGVLNLNDLAKAMRPMVAPGDEINLSLTKEGKDSHQGVGYLPDGTMIVVNHAVEKIGTNQDVIVAGAVQTSAGRLIFAELKGSTRSEQLLEKGLDTDPEIHA